MSRHVVLVAVLGLAAAACSDPTATVRDQLNLDRPVDVSFACYGGLRITGGDAAEPTDPVVESAMPTAACDIRSLPGGDPPNIPLGQEVLGMGADPSQVDGYGFVLQSVPGTVGIARFPNKPSIDYRGGEVVVIDADSLTPGKNGITVGSVPVAIATDTAGCHVVTANSGSCDLSVLTINSVLQRNPAPEINRVAVVNGAATPVEILAKPAAMLAEPAIEPVLVGNACEATPQGVFYVAYPGCHIVAAVDGGSGAIIEAIEFATDGSASVIPGSAVSCPVECGDDRDLPTAGPHPVTLDVVVDKRVGTRRMVIGAEDDSVVTVVELDAANRFGAIAQIPLSDDIGILDVSMSGQIGMGGSRGERDEEDGPGGQFQFVYAVATDGTVRVADVLTGLECDTQIDPRFIHDENNIGFLSCLPVGDPALPRRAGARSAGISLLGETVPISVRIFAADRDDPNTVANPDLLVGWFAAVGTSGGNVAIVNIDDDFYADTEDEASPIAVTLPLALPHQLRDSIFARDLPARITNDAGQQVPICDTQGPQFDDPDRDAGGPRLADDPVRFLNTAFIAASKAYALPGLRSLLCEGDDTTQPVSELGFAAPDEIRESAYPDLRAIRKDEVWNLVWEGSVSRDSETTAVDGPPIRVSPFYVDGTGMRVEDPSHPFCNAGTELHDIVAMRGCDPSLGDAHCPTGYACYVHPDAQVSAGSCLPNDQIDFLSAPCRDFLIGVRRYGVASAKSGVLKLTERPRVLRTTPVDGCTSTAQCDQLYVVEQRFPSDLHPVAETTVPDPRTFSCEPDASRGGPDRCVMTCDPQGDDSDCDAGNVCNAAGRCVEGIIPPLQCVQALQRYEIRVNDAFSVVGTLNGFQHGIIEDPATQACIKDPDANPLLVSRIPLTAPPCVGDGLADLSPNPCEVTLSNTDYKTVYLPGTCDLASPAEAIVTEDVTAIRYRSPQMTYHLVNPTYQGDAVCKGDGLGTLGEIPAVFPGMTIQFEQVDGLVVKAAPIAATFPVRVVGGPQNSLWIVDEGDFLSTSASTASTRGKVFRVEARDIGTINILQ